MSSNSCRLSLALSCSPLILAAIATNINSIHPRSPLSPNYVTPSSRFPPLSGLLAYLPWRLLWPPHAHRQPYASSAQAYPTDVFYRRWCQRGIRRQRSSRVAEPSVSRRWNISSYRRAAICISRTNNVMHR
ncbi:hypothetical protein EI94DRAFT_925781 [Lactarius quietus]|nr:hypothetical protein EI94DRAFT_925781 [Lactarius quietus]